MFPSRAGRVKVIHTVIQVLKGFNINNCQLCQLPKDGFHSKCAIEEDRQVYKFQKQAIL